MKKNYFTLFMAVMFAFAANAQDVVLWGGKGSKDGEFDGGLNGWTTKGTKSSDQTKAAAAVWSWIANGTIDKSAYVTGVAVASASKANGAAVFNSDFLDNGGSDTAAAAGTGPAPAPNAGELISPTIDLSAEKNGVAVIFSQTFVKFRGKTFIKYSNDGGTTWSKEYGVINNEVQRQATLSAAANMINRVQLPGAGGTKDFKFKFTFDGDYYAWILDDVSVVRLEEYNLRVNRNFFATPENYHTPLSQVRGVQFLNDIQNLGGKAQDATHYITVRQSNVAVFADSLKYAPFPKDSTIENKGFKTTFAAKTKGSYVGSYSIAGANKDFDANDNTINFGFVISDSTFAKDARRNRSVTPSNYIAEGVDNSWYVGNMYYIPKGKGLKSGTVEFGLENGANAAVKGQKLYISLREWDDVNKNKEVDDLNELPLVGFLEYTITGTEKAQGTSTTQQKQTIVSLPNFVDDGKPITLKDNTYYVAMVEYDGASKLAVTPTLSANNDVDYGAASLAYEQAGLASYPTIVKLADDANVYTAGFGVNYTPTIRWNIVSLTTGIDDIKLAETTVKVGPNPTADFVNVNFNFENTMKAVTVKVVDMNGRNVMTSTYENILNDTKTLDVSNLVVGSYQMFIVTGEGTVTKQFTVQH